MLIDVSYFIEGSRRINNAVAETRPTLPTFKAQDSVSANSVIEAYIKENQFPYLCNAVGVELATIVEDYIGKEEKNEEMERLVSMLRESFADFVLFRYLRNVNHQISVGGVVELKTSNTIVSPINRQVNAWNDMVRRHRDIFEYAKHCSFKLIMSRDYLTEINTLNL